MRDGENGEGVAWGRVVISQERVRRGRLASKLRDVAVCLAVMAIVAGVRGAGCAGAVAARPVAADPMAHEAERRNDELVKQGFNLTRTVRLATSDVVQFEVVVPRGHDEQVIAVWIAAERAEVSVQWRDAAGTIVTAWSARNGEQRFTRALVPGRHTIELRAGAGRAQAVIGVKGAVVGTCPVDRARWVEQPAEPAKGFAWPYVLVTPKPGGDAVGAHTLMVVPPNTGFVTEDVELVRAAVSCQVADQLALADRLGTPILAPLFPRPSAPPPDENLYLHALSRTSLQTPDAKLARVDQQLIAMIDHARERLGRDTNPRVLITGFSAAGMFANRFAVLHPQRVLAAAIGAPGGWPIAPVATAGGRALPYPVGIADVEALTGAAADVAELRRVRFVFVLGDADRNDAVPYRDAFSPADEKLIMGSFGRTPVARWDAARRLYESAGLQARFKLYRGAGHELTGDMRSDIEATFRAALAAP